MFSLNNTVTKIRQLAIINAYWGDNSRLAAVLESPELFCFGLAGTLPGDRINIAGWTLSSHTRRRKEEKLDLQLHPV